MRSSERLALLGLGSAVALASAAVVLALDHYGVVNLSPATVTAPTSALPEAHVAASVDRLSGQDVVRPAELAFGSPLLAPRTGLPAPEETADAETIDEGWQAWSVVTVLERTLGRLPRLAARSPLRRGEPSPRPGGGPQHVSLSERLAEISPAATKRLTAKFESAHAAWPPTDVGLVAVKDEKILELHVRSNGGPWTFVHRYPVLAASGTTGPKLRQGDKQVPEGIYGISLLNPNSRYHVSLRVNYPNAFDREMAAKDHRANLGGDIMIHGKNASVGCLAVGDEAAEEIFVLASRVGLKQVRLVIAPTDFRRNRMPVLEPGHPAWLPKLYTEVAGVMSEFKAPPGNILLSLFGL